MALGFQICPSHAFKSGGGLLTTCIPFPFSYGPNLKDCEPKANSFYTLHFHGPSEEQSFLGYRGPHISIQVFFI